MRKIKILGAAFVAVLAFSAVAAAGASAHEWLKLSGEKVTKVENATTDGLLLLSVNKVSFFFGGGNIKFHCDGQFQGTVGPNGTDSITLATNLSGGEGDEVACEVAESSNSICVKGATAKLKPLNLSWNTQLTEGTGTPIYDDITTTVGSKEVGYGLKCAGVEGTCEVALERSKFDENKAGSGALFLFLKELKGHCNIAEEGLVEGHGEVLGFLVS